MNPYVRRPDEGEALWFLGNLVTIKIAGEQTRGRVTVAEFVNPAGFAPPLHRHLDEDEMFYLLSGSVRIRCDDVVFEAGPGDFVHLPVGHPHTFVVGPDEPLRVLQITTPAGFERFAAEVGEPARQRRLPDPGPVDPTTLGHAAARHAIEILGPPPRELSLLNG
ncbi:cupin domain-containing protein [Amycolatopsis acidicola]|uniref:Cupin domain-containing protein n=1 Tax=Amycolatopsis acidicola TaxID=2596893 RepID=A0A5N0UZZ4_9PSEU|nr:quercetin 2,3-dioxygenase [Amycolatopsis acidicola]KAA9159437.1 cupin domain-containing protein [Amycolatopsis acidicola]